MNLTQQLEDKKKELMKEDKSILVNSLISLGKENTNLNKKLEQAIAEMQIEEHKNIILRSDIRCLQSEIDNLQNLLQKQRQEILDEVKEEIVCHSYGYKYSEEEILHSIDNIRKQLNQPKTEE